MSDEIFFVSINRLCTYLERYYKKDVIVLLDEYDTPVQESWLAGNWDETGLGTEKQGVKEWYDTY